MRFIDACWRHVHLKLIALAEAPAASFEARVKGGERDHAPPPAGHEVRELERRWANCKTDRDRLMVIKDAQDTLYSFTDRKPRAIPGTEEWKMEIARDPRSSREVARVYGVSWVTVTRYRKQYGQGD